MILVLFDKVGEYDRIIIKVKVTGECLIIGDKKHSYYAT